MYATVTVSITVNTADDVDVVSRILRAGLGSATDIRVEPAAAPAPAAAAPAASAAPAEPPMDTSKLPRKKAKPAVAVEPAAPALEPVVEAEPAPVAVEAPKPASAAPAAPAAPALNQVSLDDVKAAVRARIEAKGIEDVKAIFEAHGGAKLSDFKVDAYWSLVTDLREGL